MRTATCVGLMIAAFVAQTALTAERIARAASFSCGRAHSVREKTVCDEALLSQKDEQLAKLYTKAGGELLASGDLLLQHEERSWLHTIDAICPSPAPGFRQNYKRSGKAPDRYTICLATLYKWRIEDLQSVGLLPPRTLSFNQKVSYCGRTLLDDRDHSGEITGVSFRHATIPLIEGPTTPAESAWNVLSAAKGTPLGCDGANDYTLTYRLGWATSQLVSVAWLKGLYVHGEPRAQTSQWNETYVIGEQLRSIETSDLFNMKTAWLPRLSALLQQRTEETVRRVDLSPLATASFDWSAVAQAPSRWFIVPEGVEFDFFPGELGLGDMFAPEVTVPWKSLLPVLAPSFLAR